MNFNKILLFILIFICFIAIPTISEAGGAYLYVTPPNKSFGTGEEFVVSVKINTGDTPINVVKTVLYFSKDKLSVLDISKEGSIFSLWPEEPKFSNETGEISFVGGSPHPGFIGTNGQVISIKFKAQVRGAANLNFGESHILVDDGKGTDIFSYAEKGSYTINFPAPIIFSSTHLNEEKWYSNNKPEFHWELSPEIIDVSFVLDKNPDTEPDNISEGRLNSRIFEEIIDGIWYFHLKVKGNFGPPGGLLRSEASEASWSSTRHFTVNIDTTSPRLFEIAVNNEGDPTNPRPILYFDVYDDVSGIEYYKINFESGDSVILANPGINQYQLPLQEPGTHQIVVQAYDKAGNFRENVTGIVIKPIEQPIVTVWPRIYTAGEERFYIEGEALPQTEIMVFLEKDKNITREWKTSSDNQGLWKFTTIELLESGIYHLFTRAQDVRGALSEFSPKQDIEVIFSGLAIGPLLITFRNLVLILAIILSASVILVVYFIQKNIRSRKKLKRETKEAEESLHKGFSELKEDIVKEVERLEGVKTKKELNEAEKKVVENLRKDLEEVEKYISKEIKDVEKELE